MEQQHKIAEVVFNIVFAEHGQMLKRSGMLAGLVRNRLAPRISDVLDAWATGPDEVCPDVVCIDRLELDLGTVAYDDLEAALALRLGQALQNVLRTGPTGTNSTAAASVRRVTAQQSDLDLIMHFLATGRLPWWAERRSQADITRTLSALIDNVPRKLIASLQQQSAPPNPVLARLVRQFESRLVRRLIARLAPSAARIVDRGMAALAALHITRAVLPLPGRQLACTLWETLLRRLLASPGALHAAEALVAAALQETAAALRFNPKLLHQNLKIAWGCLRSTEQGADLEGPVGNLMTYLERGATGRSAPHPPWRQENAMTPHFALTPVHGNPLTGPAADAALQALPAADKAIAPPFLPPPLYGNLRTCPEGDAALQSLQAPDKRTTPQFSTEHTHGHPPVHSEPDNAGRATPPSPPAPEPARTQDKAKMPQFPPEHTHDHPPVYSEPDNAGHAAPPSPPVPEPAWTSQFPLEDASKHSVTTSNPGRIDPSAPPLAPLVQDWVTRLSEGRAHPRPELFHTIWKQVLSAPPETARAVIYPYVRREPVRHALARYLSRQQFQDLLEVMEPRNAEFMAALAGHLVHLQPVGTAPPAGPASVCTRFRELTLTYLLEEGTTRFNREHYCAGTLHRLAVHSNMADKKLLSRIRRCVAAATGREEKNRQSLLTVLDNLRTQMGASDTRPHDRGDTAPSPSDRLSARRRHILPAARLPAADLLDPVSSRMGPTAPMEVLPDPLQDLPGRIGSKPDSASRRLPKRAPGAGLKQLADWPLQGDRPPAPPTAKAVCDTTRVENSGHDRNPASERLADDKPATGRDTSRPPAQPGHVPASSERIGLRHADPSGPSRPPASGAFPSNASAEPAKSAPSRQTSGSDCGLPDAAPTACRCQTHDDCSGTPNTRFDTNPSIYVANAGMVLAGPFLPRLFGLLDWLEEKKFKSRSAAERAVHLLEFMVSKRQAAPEFELVLNKILCGLSSPRPLAGGFDPTDREIDAVQRMLEGMIGHWKIIGNTSVAGLRNSFLQRQGYLTLTQEAWHLQVEGRSYDMLLDRLPWSISVIKHPWMTRVVHVNWR